MRKLVFVALICVCNVVYAEIEPLFPREFSNDNEKFVWKHTEGRFYSYRTCISVEDMPTCAARFPLEFANISRQNANKGIIAQNSFMCGNGSKPACEKSIEASKELNKLIQEYPSVRGK